MAQVPEKVLAWLYSVLHEYQDPQRTYSDTARVLAAFPNIILPRTEVHTAENGASDLLLVLNGNLPVAYRGMTYRFPIKIWIPQAYPREAPLVYVTPGRDMMIRPGQHVGIDGRVYLPYLRDWAQWWNRASVGELLEYLQQIFAKEPPVISKPKQQQRPESQQDGHQAVANSHAPRLPPKQRPGSPSAIQSPIRDNPPPRPPKPGESHQDNDMARDPARDGPPLPPLPRENLHNLHHDRTVHLQNGSSSRQFHVNAAPYPNEQAQLPRPHGPYTQVSNNFQDNSSPVSLTNMQNQSSGYPGTSMNPPEQDRSQRSQPQQHYNHYIPQASMPAPHPHAQQFHQRAPPAQSFPIHQYAHRHGPHQLPTQKSPPVDLLSDPFEVSLPEYQGKAPAPPIPPNPEKEHLLQALSASLVHQANQKISQNLSTLAPLQAQHNALLGAHARLETEIRQLEQLSMSLDSNERILHSAIQECDRTIASAKSKPQPPIDDVLVAPTIVAQQLWNLIAEEAAIREAMYVLQKAVDSGRISADVFVKQMRGLGREAFLKMALARKCAQGMGLDMSA